MKNLPALQFWLSGAALVAFLAFALAATSLGYGWYRAAIQQAAVDDKKEMARKQTSALRATVLEKLRTEFIETQPDVPPAVAARLMMPPADWLNGRLEELGADWRYPETKPAE